MSHLLKKNKTVFFYFKVVIAIFILFIFFNAFFNYKGSKFVYLIFSIISNYLIYFSFRKKSIFFESFFGILLWLGFWFKFSIIISFLHGFTEGLNNYDLLSTSDIDYALVISTVGFLGFIISGYLRQIFFSYPTKIYTQFDGSIYKKYRKIILLLFCIIICIVFLLNVFFKIYQRGVIPHHGNFIFSGSIKVLLLYGLTLCSAMILYVESVIYKKIYFSSILISILEVFLSSISMLSRSMIFNISALFFALYKFSNKISMKIKFSFFFKIFLLTFIFFYISVILVNYLRINYFFIGADIVSYKEIIKLKMKDKSINTYDLIKKKDEYQKDDYYLVLDKKKNEKLYSFESFYSLIVRRWVGIESVIIINSKKNILGFNFLNESIKEEFDPHSSSFYEKNFQLKDDRNLGKYINVKGNTLPGLIAFLYYSGSLIFLFFSIIALCFFAFLLEFLSFKLSNYNLLISAVIGQIIAYRFIHFGYLPKQSYLLFGSIIAIILLLFLFRFLINKFKKKTFNTQY
jgi:hypothetical protein